MLLLFLCAEKSRGQFYFSDNKYLEKKLGLAAGAAAGVMNCITDLGGGKNPHHINGGSFRPAAGIFFSAIYKNFLSLRLDFSFGQISAADSILEPVRAYVHGRYERNLSFKSNINELALNVEYYPFNTPSRLKKFSPYLLAGTGLFSFDPRAKLNGQWYLLRPLCTEGQGFSALPDRKAYHSMQGLFAAGAGIKFEVNSLVQLQLEGNYRFLHTDYLDDVSTSYIDPVLFDIYLPEKQAIIAKNLYKRTLSAAVDGTVSGDQRGNPQKNDAYFSIMFRTAFLLGRKQR